MKLLLNPFAFAVMGKIADSMTTAYTCLKYGTEKELIAFTRAYMEEFGIVKGIILHNFYALIVILGIAAVLYGLDHLIEITGDSLNFHKLWLYGIGGLTYFAAFSNSVGILTGTSIVGLIIDAIK